MQAIITKFIAPTNTRSSRYKATCERGSLMVEADYSLDASENHRAVCDALCARFDKEDVEKYGTIKAARWSRPKASGQIPSGEYVFCFIPERVFKRGDDNLADAASAFLDQQNVTNRAALRQALEKIHANAAESVEWIRRVASEALTEMPS